MLSCVAICFVAFLASNLFMPIGIIFAILLLFSTMTYISIYAGYPKVEELMITPYYKNNPKEAEEAEEESRADIPERTGKGYIENDED